MVVLVEQYSDKYDCVISADEGGFVEYWQPAEPFTLPKNVPKLWNYKSETDLYEFKKVSIKSPYSYPLVDEIFLGRQNPHQLA